MLLFCASPSLSIREPNIKFEAFGVCMKATQISISNFAYLKLAASIVNILLHKDWPQTAIYKHAETAVLPLSISCFVLLLKDIKNHFKIRKNLESCNKKFLQSVEMMRAKWRVMMRAKWRDDKTKVFLAKIASGGVKAEVKPPEANKEFRAKFPKAVKILQIYQIRTAHLTYFEICRLHIL